MNRSWARRLPAAAVAALAASALALAACGGDNGGGSDGEPEYPYPVQTFDNQGQDHLDAGETYDGYNSNPPTSGPHAPAAASWGVSPVPLPKEVPVHNMEHGGVIVWYNCQGGPEPLTDEACQQLAGDLAAIVQPAAAARTEVLMTEYAGMPNRIALTAWQKLDAFDEFDAARVQAFIDFFECRFDPEHICR